jgi:hypothetical protein
MKPEFKKNRQISIHGSSKLVSEKNEKRMFLKSFLSYLACSQNLAIFLATNMILKSLFSFSTNFVTIIDRKIWGHQSSIERFSQNWL